MTRLLKEYDFLSGKVDRIQGNSRVSMFCSVCFGWRVFDLTHSFYRDKIWHGVYCCKDCRKRGVN